MLRMEIAVRRNLIVAPHNIITLREEKLEHRVFRVYRALLAQGRVI